MKKTLLVLVLVALVAFAGFGADLKDYSDEDIAQAAKNFTEQIIMGMVDGNVEPASLVLWSEFQFNDMNVGEIINACETENEMYETMANVWNYIGKLYIDAGYGAGYEFYSCRLSKWNGDYLLFYAKAYNGETATLIYKHVGDDRIALVAIGYE